MTFDGASTAEIVITSSLSSKLLGEDWIDAIIGSETWTDVIAGSEVWTQVQTGTETWARQ